MPQTLREQFHFAQSLKEEGNFLYKQQDYINAIKKYSKVRAFLKPMMPGVDGDDNSAFINMIGKGDEGDKLTADENKEAVQI